MSETATVPELDIPPPWLEELLAAMDVVPDFLPELLAKYGDAPIVEAYKPGHPLLPITRDWVDWQLEGGLENYNAEVRRRNAAIHAEENDPLLCGHEPPTWKLADVLWGWITWEQFLAEPDVPAEWKESAALQQTVEAGPRLPLALGGNRAAKTEYMMKRVVECAKKYDDAYIWVFHENEPMSVDFHQRVIWKYLPTDWKEAGRGQVGYVTYNQKNGFTEQKLVGPNGSTIRFVTYEQYQKKPSAFEGGQLGEPGRRRCLGFVADELIPVSLWETLRARLATRDAVGFTGFTPKDGYNDTVAKYLDGSTPVLFDTVDGVLDTKTGMAVKSQVVERCQDNNCAVVYFFSKWNPYGNYEALMRQYASENLKTQLMRFAGRAIKATEARFPRFSDAADSVHLFDPKDVPEHGTRWMVIDPAGLKNWFKLWGLVDVYSRLWIYREWPCCKIEIPDVGFPEPWAIAGRNQGHPFGGIPGGGSKPFVLNGFSLLQYKYEIARLEGWKDTTRPMTDLKDWREGSGAREEIYERMMDSKFANTPRGGSMGNTTLLMECMDIGLDCVPTETRGYGTDDPIDHGVMLINDKLAYTEGYQTPMAGPKLFISRECENLIFALKNWTGRGGKTEATKDPIDCLRYLVCLPVFYADGERKRAGNAKKHNPLAPFAAAFGKGGRR